MNAQFAGSRGDRNKTLRDSGGVEKSCGIAAEMKTHFIARYHALANRARSRCGISVVLSVNQCQHCDETVIRIVNFPHCRQCGKWGHHSNFSSQTDVTNLRRQDPGPYTCGYRKTMSFFDRNRRLSHLSMVSIYGSFIVSHGYPIAPCPCR